MIKPMLCQHYPKPFNDPNFIWEIKYDGARILAKVDSAGAKLQARSGSDKTLTFPELKIRTAVPALLDGEVVVYSNGKTKFNDIQKRINRQNGIRWGAETFPAVYEVFDMLEVESQGQLLSLRHTPLLKRKELLGKILIPSENVRLSPWVDADGVGLYEQAKEKQWEGIIGKNKNGIYLEGKREWLKVKLWQEDSFLVVGYTEGTGWRAPTFGALVLSDYKGQYVGAVGTGFNDNEIAMIYAKLIPSTCPWPREPEKATWVKPFPVKVRFLEYTADHILRFPSYKGLI